MFEQQTCNCGCWWHASSINSSEPCQHTFGTKLSLDFEKSFRCWNKIRQHGTFDARFEKFHRNNFRFRNIGKNKIFRQNNTIFFFKNFFSKVWLVYLEAMMSTSLLVRLVFYPILLAIIKKTKSSFANLEE